MDLVSQNLGFLEWIRQPWHWAVSGIGIAFVLFLLNWMGRSFGVSTSFKAICTALGAGKRYEFFAGTLSEEYWRLLFVLGAVVGGAITTHFLSSPEPVALSAATITELEGLGITYPDSDHKGMGFMPTSLFNLSNVKGILMMVLGGFLVGFGARYGRGCTSGHAVTGLAHLQLPSFLTVIGFFIGGLIMTWLIFPFLMSL